MSLGGLEAICAGMAAHRGAPSVQEEGAAALSNLCLEPRHKGPLLHAGGVATGVAVLRAHRGRLSVLTQASTPPRHRGAHRGATASGG